MRTKFQRERLRIEGEKPNFKLLEFSNSWIGIVILYYFDHLFGPCDLWRPWRDGPTLQLGQWPVTKTFSLQMKIHCHSNSPGPWQGSLDLKLLSWTCIIYTTWCGTYLPRGGAPKKIYFWPICHTLQNYLWRGTSAESLLFKGNCDAWLKRWSK